MTSAEMIKSMMEASIRPQTYKSEDDQVRMLEENRMAECVFEVGDLITPKSDSPLRGAGNPSKVVSVFSPQFTPRGADGDPVFPHNMVVARVVRDEVVYYLGNSDHYERWYKNAV